MNGTNKKPMGGFGLLVLGRVAGWQSSRVAGWDTGQVHTVKRGRVAHCDYALCVAH